TVNNSAGEIYGQVFNNDGTKDGNYFKVFSDAVSYNRYHVQGMTLGGFIVSFSATTTTTTNGFDILQKFYDINNVYSSNPLAVPLFANFNKSGSQQYPYIVALPDNNYVILC